MKLRWVALGLVLLAGTPARAGDYEFLVIGDTRPRFESESFRPFENLITKINALKPALVINLGDLIYGYGLPGKESQWDKYQAVARTIEPPYYQVPGNHDTHSKAARKIYARRFGKFYESFDYGDCHFVLLDTTENQRWGYIGPEQLDWLKRDLKETRAPSVFVFTHFPTWEPERIAPGCYEFWRGTLHPLFKASRVKAVFGGHFHTYGPTREFDGIRYFISGGGGAELIPEYKKSGGEHHFMRVKVSGERFDVRVVTERGELTDAEADVMGGLQFASRNVSRIGIKGGTASLKEGVSFNVSVTNPYQGTLTGEATWMLDASAFSVQPPTIRLQIAPGATRQYLFTLKALQDSAALQSLPRLEFQVASPGKTHRFHREVRFLQDTLTPYRAKGPTLDGDLAEWGGVPKLHLGRNPQARAELATCFDAQNLYLAFTVPAPDTAEAAEMGLSDEVQIGLARRLSESDFGGDLLRLGISSSSREVMDRTPGRKAEAPMPGARSICLPGRGRNSYEIAIPLRLLSAFKPRPGGSLILDLSFPQPDGGPDTQEPPEPAANTFAYRVRYGSDSLVPVYFVELNLEPKR